MSFELDPKKDATIISTNKITLFSEIITKIPPQVIMRITDVCQDGSIVVTADGWISENIIAPKDFYFLQEVEVTKHCRLSQFLFDLVTAL